MKDIRITHRARTLFLALSIAMMLIGAARSYAESFYHFEEIYYRAYDHDKHSWLPYVSGTDTFQHNDYAGRYGHSIDGICIGSTSPEIIYRVHYKGGSWLPDVTCRSYDFAGIYGRPIDVITMHSTGKGAYAVGFCDTYYRVHIKNGSWLPLVECYEYAGILGKEIDALQVYVWLSFEE